MKHSTPDRNLALELVRVTEAAAMAGGRWVGRGDKNRADGAAVEAMRAMISTVSMRGVVVIGEGEKDNAPMLFNGELVGDGSGPEVDVAVDPIDGTTLTAKGMPNAVSVMAVSNRGAMYDPSAVFYMDKLATGPEAAEVVDIRLPVRENIRRIARAKGETAADVTVVIDDPDLDVTPASVLVLRNAGPLGGPGMPEWGMLPIPRKLLAAGVRDMVRISDARMSGTAYGTCVLHVAPESFTGGPLALVQTGDLVTLDVPSRRLDLQVSEAELASRRSSWVPREFPATRGYERLFASHVTQAPEGCDFDFLHGAGGVPEPAIH